MYRIYKYNTGPRKASYDGRNLENFILNPSNKVQTCQPRSYGPNSYFNEMKPIFIMLRIIGRFPYSFTKTGFAPFSLLSWAFMYSCFFNLVLYVLTAWSIGMITRIGIYKSKSYDETLYYAQLILFSLQSFTAPFTYWWDAPRTIRYFQTWKQFEEFWKGEAVTTTRRCKLVRLLTLAFTPFAFLFIFVEMNFLPSMPWLVFALYVPIMMSSMFHLIHWYLTLYELTQFSEHLLKEILKDTEKSEIGYSRRAWVKICELASEIGNATGASGLSWLITIFVTFVMSSYGILVNLMVTFGSEKSYWGLLMSTAYCGTYSYILMDAGHQAVVKIGPKFSQRLLLIDISFLPTHFLNEIELLVKCIEAKPPVVDYLGFIKITRNTFVHFVSSSVTYLIVLLQLKTKPGQQPTTDMQQNINENTTSYTTL